MASASRALALLALLPACSWAFVEQPPRYDTGKRPLTCTSSSAAPAADSVISIVLLATAAAAGIGAAGDEARVKLVVSIPAVLAAVPYGFSAGYGYLETMRCRRLGRIRSPRYMP